MVKIKRNLKPLLIAVLISLAPSAAQAFTFDKNFLISDGDLTNEDALSVAGIEAFLAEKGSVLNNYTTTDTDGTEKTVARVIKRVSKSYNLSPMLFLVMAQKESSAITSSTLTYAIENWILGYGRCDSCSEEQAAPYRGIAKQFESAGDRIRNSYLADLASKGTTISGWGVGKTKTTIDGIEVTPENDATAALYTYNPCVGAYGGGYSQFGCNSAFQKIWQEWNPEAIRYPNGSLIQVGGTVYLIQKGVKRPFTSWGALITNYNEKRIIPVSTLTAAQYKKGAPISYPNYSLIRNPHGTIYLLVNGKKRGFASQAVFQSFGYNPEEVIDARWSEIDPVPEGLKITNATPYPQGALLQNNKTGAVVYIDPRGKRHPIWSQEILENRFSSLEVEQMNPKEIKQFPKVAPLKLKDGTLVRTKKGGTVYVIANGKKRPIESAAVFDQFGYKWENVLTVTQEVLQLHPKGKALTVNSSSSA